MRTTEQQSMVLVALLLCTLCLPPAVAEGQHVRRTLRAAADTQIASAGRQLQQASGSANCGDSPSCLAACFMSGTCAGGGTTTTGSVPTNGGASIEGSIGSGPKLAAPSGSQVASGDGSNFFASAINKSLTCYGVVNGKSTTYQAKPDVNGVLTCSKSQQTAGGIGAAIEGTQGLPPAASGAFLPERTRDPVYQGATYPYLDNPGRVPGQYADALNALLSVPKPAPNIAKARMLAAEAQTKFLANAAAPLPRSLDRPTLLPITRVYGPDFYSSALGGASLMLQLLRLYVADPVASAQYLKAAVSFADAMMTAGTDRYGAVHSPLFASVLLVASPPKLPADVTLSQVFPPAGGFFRPDNFPNVFLGAAEWRMLLLDDGGGPSTQVYWGANVAADQDLYQLLYQLTTVTGQQRYAAAADAALTSFLASTVAPESGLLPWGAYAQWDFRRDTWARGLAGYNGTGCCPNEYQLHKLVPVPRSLWARLWALNETAMQEYTKAIVQGSVVNIGSPAQMAYDGRAALWGTPRAAAAASPLAPPSIQPRLSVLVQNAVDGALLLQIGAYSLLYSTDHTFQKGIENVWVAFATGIMGQKTKYNTAAYPSGNFTLDGRPAGGLVAPAHPIETAAAAVAQMLPATGLGSSYRAALLQLAAGATLTTLGRSTTG